ncbi:MAG: hypothetical protein Q7S11_00225 [bacterium]|nr:hypothetical protein [bacterium]
MKKILLIITLFFTPVLLFAMQNGYIDSLVNDLAPRLSLWSGIIIAITASVMVFVNARSMKGGVFGTVLGYFAVGMIFILGSSVVISLDVFGTGEFVRTANNILFILGYITMALAADKLSRVAQQK